MASIHAGHRQRMKEKFLSNGIDPFSDHEIIEILLYYALPRQDTNRVAHELMERYGSLHSVLEAAVEDLCQTTNISRNSATLLKLIPSISNRYMVSKSLEKSVIDSSSKAGEIAKGYLLGKTNEVFCIMCLDTRKKLNYMAKISEGTINETAVYTRSIVEHAIRYRADSIILCHNHPAGSIQPSRADLDVTVRLVEALKTINVKVVDHIIVAGDVYYSFADNGMI